MTRRPLPSWMQVRLTSADYPGFIRNPLALGRIIVVLARHDALFPLAELPMGSSVRAVLTRLLPPRPGMSDLRPGERLALALPHLGPTFIKLGQGLSTRADLLGEVMARDLSLLQDRLPPFPTEIAMAQIETDLEAPIDSLFRRFEPVAVAAASVAQVHFATTSDGREVAVKVLRPGIAAAFARDMDLLMWLARTILWLQPSLRRLKPVEAVRQLTDAVRFELDLRLEAAAGSELAGNFKGDPDFRVPAIDWLRTAKHVLTTERVRGIQVDERDRLIAAGHEPREIIAKASAAFFNMVFRDGFFHADLHPGNMFVAEDGALVAIDFGIMGRLDRQHRYYLADMLLAFLVGDYRRVADIHFDAGFVPATESRDDFMQAARAIGEPLLERPLNEISVARLLTQLFETTATFKMETQPQLLMLQKTIVLAEGLGRQLEPSINMWELARPLIQHWMQVNRSPPARALAVLGDFASRIDRLPALLDDAERVVQALSTRGLRLDDASIARIAGRPGGGWGVVLPLWIAALALAVLAAHVILQR